MLSFPGLPSERWRMGERWSEGSGLKAGRCQGQWEPIVVRYQQAASASPDKSCPLLRFSLCTNPHSSRHSRESDLWQDQEPPALSAIPSRPAGMAAAAGFALGALVATLISPLLILVSPIANFVRLRPGCGCAIINVHLVSARAAFSLTLPCPLARRPALLASSPRSTYFSPMALQRRKFPISRARLSW